MMELVVHANIYVEISFYKVLSWDLISVAVISYNRNVDIKISAYDELLK